MKKIISLCLFLAAFVMAEGSLWSMNVDAYQVQVPETVACDKTGDDYGALCYETTGGWWFVYTGDTKDGQLMSFSPIGENDDGTYKLITTDELDGSILPGGNLVEGTGLVLTMSAEGGSSDAPALAGIGFNWTKAETPIDISAHPGYCISYGWTAETDLQLELGWNEDKDNGGYGYDSWYALLPGTAGAITTLDLPWSKFKQDGWDKAKQPITVATKESKAMKIRLKNGTAAKIAGTLTISQIGWSGECFGGVSAINSTMTKTSDMSLVGKIVSFGKAVNTVNIVNLTGEIVASYTNTSMVDLSNLTTGVYMIKADAQSKMITIK